VTLEFDEGTLTRDLGQGLRTKAGKGADALAEGMVGKHLVRWDLRAFASSNTAARAAVLDAASKATDASGAWDPEAEIQRLRANAAWCGKHPTSNLLEQAIMLTREHVETHTGRCDLPLSEFEPEWAAETLTWAEREQKRLNKAKTEAAKTVDRLNSEERPVLRGSLKGAKAALAKAEEALRKEEIKIAAAAVYAEDAATLASRLASKEAALKAMLDRADAFEKMAEPTTTLDDLQAAHTAAEAALVKARERAATRRAEHTRAVSDQIVADKALAFDDPGQPEPVSDRCLVHDEAPQVQGEFPTPCPSGQFVSSPMYLEEGQRLTTAAAGNFAVSDVRWLVDCAAALDVSSRLGKLEQASEAAAVKCEHTAEAKSRAESMAQIKARKATAAEEALDAAKTWATVRARVEEERAQVAAITEEVQALQVQIGEAKAAGKGWETAQAGPSLLQAAVDEAKATVSQHERAAGREDALRAAVKDRDSATDLWRQAKVLRKALEEIKQRIAAAAYAPLCELAQEFLSAAGIPLRVYINNPDDFGAVKTDLESRPAVVFWALSTSERALVGAALAQALARLTDQKWRALVLDEVEAIDAARLPHVLTTLADMVDGDFLDNVVLAMVAAEEPEELGAGGVTTHWLGANRG